MWREDVPMSKSPLRFFLFVTRPHLKFALAAMLAVITASILFTSVTYVFKYITDAVANLGSGGSYDQIFWAAAVYIAVEITGSMFMRVSGFMGARWATGMRAGARFALTSYVTKHSRGFFADRFAGSLASKISSAAKGMTDMMELFLWQFLSLAVSVVTSFVIAYFVSPILAFIFFAWVIFILVVNLYFARKRRPIIFAAQALETRLTGLTVDLLSNISAMQEYARRSHEIEHMQDVIQKRRAAGLRAWRYGEWILMLNGLTQVFFGGAMIFFVVQLGREGIVSPGDVILILALIFRMQGLLIFLGSNFKRIADTWTEVEESLEEIIEPHEIVDAHQATKLRVSGGALDFRDVTFIYGSSDKEVMRKFSLAVPAKQKVGLVGRSGAGKSTLVKILLRHYDIQGGVIAIDEQNIAEVTQDSLREAVALVPQEPLLFHRMLRDNIAYGKPDASDIEIQKAAKLAQAHDFISALPKGYETLVGERGVKLSGGERQRIAIARAILKNAPILILDEATASLDSESEVAIQKALHELMQGKTVIAIAHRLSTLREMDRIIVLDQGQITEEGTHTELLEKGGIYSELWKHQAGGFLQDE
jgi:ATP-binding cassette, subfamily B, bacterial